MSDCRSLTCACQRFRVGDVVRDPDGPPLFMTVVGVSPHGRDGPVWLAVRDVRGGPVEEYGTVGWRTVHDESK